MMSGLLMRDEVVTRERPTSNELAYNILKFHMQCDIGFNQMRRPAKRGDRFGQYDDDDAGDDDDVDDDDDDVDDGIVRFAYSEFASIQPLGEFVATHRLRVYRLSVRMNERMNESRLQDGGRPSL
jgi:hypothetical protein